VNDEPLLKARDVAEILGLEVRTIVKRAQDGDIPCVRLWGRHGAPLRFRPDDIQRCLAQWSTGDHDA
jgi:predicted site-specific integrase-resolvase